MEKEVEKRIRVIMSEQLGFKKTDMKDESRFLEDLGADSLDVVEIVMALEEEFGMEIPDEEAEKLETVGQTIKYIEGRITK